MKVESDSLEVPTTSEDSTFGRSSSSRSSSSKSPAIPIPDISELDDHSELELPQPTLIRPDRQADNSSVMRFLTYIVFEAHALRLGLELSACVIAYTLATFLVPWEALGIEQKWSTMISWFGCCFVIILIDQLVLCRSVYTFRRSYLLLLAGAYERALKVLEKVGPSSTAFVRLPMGLYHLQRAKIFMHSESFKDAERELRKAEQSGANAELIAISKSRLLRLEGKPEEANATLEQIEGEIGVSSQLLFERGLQLLGNQADYWEAKKIFRQVLERQDAPHFAGETCHYLAQAFINVTMLKTGEAEEGLIQLDKSIDRFRGAVIYVDTLRPVLARLLLERSMYCATHKEPSAAILDLKVALSLCTYAELRTFAEEIKEELQWRHGMQT